MRTSSFSLPSPEARGSERQSPSRTDPGEAAETEVLGLGTTAAQERGCAWLRPAVGLPAILMQGISNPVLTLSVRWVNHGMTKLVLVQGWGIVTKLVLFMHPYIHLTNIH